MPAPANADEFLELVRKSGLVETSRLEACLWKAAFAEHSSSGPRLLADILVREGLLTSYQADCLRHGKWKGFTIGDYKVLESLGSGKMGSVFLCENIGARRAIALKILPTALAQRDASCIQRFWREAKYQACVSHRNVASVYDVGEHQRIYYIGMEYVFGSSLQHLIDDKGPLQPILAAHYIGQAAVGLKHVHMQGLIHRDIEPGNLIVDRNGIVKIIDFGLARAVVDASLTVGHSRLFAEGMLSPNFAAPEVATNRSMDHRADIYSLGAVFYFCLIGRSPLDEGTIDQKLEWLQTRRPEPIRNLRPDVPRAMAAIVERMMAKDPADRYQSAEAVAEALASWTVTRIAPPSEDELPRWCPATMAALERGQTQSTRPGWFSLVSGIWRGRG